MAVKAAVVVICIAAFIFVWSWCDLISDLATHSFFVNLANVRQHI